MIIKRALYISFLLVLVVKQWIDVRFTKGGLLVLAGLAASAVVGLDTNQTLAYQAFTFLLGLLLVSMVSILFFNSRFSARRKLPEFASAGEPVTYRVVVQNLSSKRQTALSLSEDLEDSRPTFKEFLDTPEPDEKPRNPFDRAIGYHRWLWLLARKRGATAEPESLPVFPPHAEVEIPVEMVPLRRGRLRLAGLTIACPDPLGLFKARYPISAPQSVLILPKRYALPHIRLPGARRYQPGGVSFASSVGDSQEFLSLRDYRPGDPLRRIHWKGWAKTGKPIVQEYQDEFFVRHALVLDTFQGAEYSAVFEEAVSVAASFVCSIRTQESLLDLMFMGPEAYCFTSGRGLARIENMLEILASVKVCRDKAFGTLPPLVIERAALLSGCICVLLSWDEERQEFIRRLRQLGTPLLVLVISDDKAPHGLDPGPMTDIPENFHRLQVGKIEESLASL